MDFLELAQNRYSCRSFLEKTVEQEKLDLILEAGRVAPTARNIQPQKILVLTDKSELSKLAECTKYGWNAPVILVVCYDKDIVYHRQYDDMDFGYIDTSIVTTQMMLEIQNLGLGTTWIGAFDPIKVRSAYNIPENYEIVALLPVGYPGEDAHPSKLHEDRKPIEETVFYNKF